ncbi:hypothetical protein [Bacillus suaedae]|uniref:Uncharacterized protein n=1 Tax=Halalkalibacter suaedae TaxID=2822140 RepID=A0A940WZF7_9BACI|nr:hypothetical protein [Bacillus suaedae]MBP3951486.1 hypothetical protein [Bacillus suaedae]
MSENEQAPKKLSQVDAAKQLLAKKKQKVGNPMGNNTNTKQLKSQQTKKPSNSRRKMGV